MTIDYDMLGEPVNKTAYRVISGGINYKAPRKDGHEIWDAPPKTRPINKNTPDLRGMRAGRLVVVGLLPAKNNNKSGKPAKWLCRCDCGAYTSRPAKLIKNPQTTDDKCDDCKNLHRLKKRDKKKRERMYK